MLAYSCLQNVCNCSHTQILVKILCRVLEAEFAPWKKNDAGNVSLVAKVGNIGENAYAMSIYEDYECFWENASSFCLRFIETDRPEFSPGK